MYQHGSLYLVFLRDKHAWPIEQIASIYQQRIFEWDSPGTYLVEVKVNVRALQEPR